MESKQGFILEASTKYTLLLKHTQSSRR